MASSKIQALVENVAERIAAANQGALYPAEIAAQLPLSLSMIIECLDVMAESPHVQRDEDSELLRYWMPEFFDKAPEALDFDTCVYSERALEKGTQGIVHPAVIEELRPELEQLAEQNGWPSEALWQHELLFVTSHTERALAVAYIAGHTRLTLKQTEKFLKQLASMHIYSLSDEKGDGSYHYSAPNFTYESDVFKRNEAFIRSLPNSRKDELEARVLRGVTRSIVFFALAFVAVFLRVPFIIAMPFAIFGSAFAMFRALKAKHPDPQKIDF
ncbi:MAG: hypothetical protein ACPGN3_06510 [Opitutales bacterium]